MSTQVIAAYRAKPGQGGKLVALVKEHVPFLRALGLVTDRPALAMSAKDGTIIEIFEWMADGAEQAHSHPEVQAMWDQFSQICDYVPLKELSEAGDMFAHFTPLDLDQPDMSAFENEGY